LRNSAGNKKIKVLVTAGPTWVKIDKVRVLTNIFSGKTGFLIAKAFRAGGFQVTLALGPSRFRPQDKNLNILKFKYFEELRRLIGKELGDKSYKVIIHSAAVSDYRPIRLYGSKISSSRKELILRLRPTPKLIKEIRKKRGDVFLIQFKLEVGRSRKDLINIAYTSLVKNNSDLVVANDLRDFKGLAYRAYIIDKDKNIKMVRARRELAQQLLKIVNNHLKSSE